MPRMVRPAALAGALAIVRLALMDPAHAAGIAGKIGVGTWNTQAEFTDVRVVRGTEVLYQSDFATGASGFTMAGGTWQATGGALRQTSGATPAMAFVGSPTWSDYTLTLRARKLGGAEGFLIGVGVPAANEKSWWNIGGWGNTRHAPEIPGVWADGVSGSIQTGVWYDIRVELQGSNIRCYLNGTLVHDTQRILDSADRQRRFQELIASPGFALLNSAEQQWLRDLAARGVYIGDAARATFAAVPSLSSFAALSPARQAAAIRKVNRNRLTFSLGWGFGSDVARDQAIIAGMDAAVVFDNSVGPIFDKHDVINNSPGTPTADANYDGQMRFGGSYGMRVAMHEISHTLGTGTYWAWGNGLVNGAWTGPLTNAQLAQFDGAGAVLHGDSMHYWPYGLNYDNEASPENNRRQVWIMHALRRDMGIGTWDMAGATDIPAGLYRITPRLAPSSSLEAQSAAGGAAICIRTYAGTDGQKFHLDGQSDGTYRIRTALPGNRCVELPYGVTDNGTKLRLWDGNGSAAQRWYLTPVGDGWYKISPKGNLYRGMDVTGISPADGTLVESWDYWDGFGQQWKLTLLAAGYTMGDAARALTIAAGTAQSGALDRARLNVVDPATTPIDLRDAILLARKAGGLDPNP